MRLFLLVLTTISGIYSQSTAGSNCSAGFSCVPRCPEVESYHRQLQDPATKIADRRALLSKIRQRRCRDTGGSRFCCRSGSVRMSVAETCGRPRLGTNTRVAGPINEDTANPLGSWPWMTSYGRRRRESGEKWDHLCGGTLVTARHVLTAAHCYDGTCYRARVGDAHLDNPADDHRAFESQVAKFSVHPQYSHPSAYFDVGVMTMEKAIASFDEYIVPVCLPAVLLNNDLTRDDGKLVSLTGYGLRRRNDIVRTGGPLRRAHLGIFSQRYCNSTYDVLGSQNRLGRSVRELVPSLFQAEIMCAGYEIGGVGSCPGDSGSPLVRFRDDLEFPHYEQLSIVSGGIGRCGDRDFPGIYGRVAAREVTNFVLGELKMDRGELDPTAPPGERTCEFAGDRYFHAPNIAFLRSDGKICICDDSVWIAVEGKIKPGTNIKVNDIVDVDKDLVENEDEEEDAEAEAEAEEEEDESAEAEAEDHPNSDHSDNRITTESAATQPKRQLPQGNGKSCRIRNVWYSHGSESKLNARGRICHCRNGKWVRCGSGQINSNIEDAGASPAKQVNFWRGKGCAYGGKKYPHNPGFAVAGKTHFCYCNNGLWERCRQRRT